MASAQRIELDHLAIASERVADLWPRYAGDLSADWVGMGPDLGFSFCQLRFGNGRRVEMLEPLDVVSDDFLRRFLDHSGPGPHHITFKIPDIEAMLATLDRAGYHPMRVSFEDPTWLEAFLHPKEVTGVVIQVAQASRGPHQTPPPDEPALPSPRVAPAAELVRIGHAVASLDDALRIFAAVLQGQETGRGSEADHEWVELEWPDEGRIRLLEPRAPHSPLHDWLGGRTGRIHHVAFSVDDPAGVDGAADRGDGTWEVAPADNFGLRLLLSPRPAQRQDSPGQVRQR